MTRRSDRRGFSLMLVLVFLVLLLSVWSLTYRQIASTLRIETVRSQHTTRDEGSLQALARGVALLEGGVPPSNPYICGTVVDTPSGSASFTLTFASDQLNVWTVNSAPTPDGVTVDPMPGSFVPPAP